MLERFNDHLLTKSWFHPDQQILLAVSGGVDSVVMAHLFSQSNFRFGIAHCNFKLRAKESDEDQYFVAALANELSVNFYSTTFDTTQSAAQHGQSIQMEARDLRYNWLEKIRKQEDFDWIATAHHLNDSIETLLYNFAKGCGIYGLQGIPERNGAIIRPLLFATKEEIVAFQKANHLTYREDHSNTSDKYARNRIRHQIVPVLQSLNPNFIRTAGDNIHRLKDAASLMDKTVRQLKQQFVHEANNQLQINRKGLHKLPALKTLLYEWLKPYGFNSAQVTQLLTVNPNQSGQLYYSPSHQLLVDRAFYLVQPLALALDKKEQFLLQWEMTVCTVSDGQFMLEKKTEFPNQFPDHSFQAYLQLDKEAFPLTFRHWRAGDIFQPLGMQGHHQKLQDFFSNQKVTRFDKSRIWIVETKLGEICWIVGYRIDERFKLMSDEKPYITLKFLPTNK